MSYYQVFLEKKVLKDLEKLDLKTKKRILEKLKLLRDKGFSSELDIKKLKGYMNHYRIRIGRYRILFELGSNRIIRVYAILPRKKAYR